jgi:hypothetical protein
MTDIESDQLKVAQEALKGILEGVPGIILTWGNQFVAGNIPELAKMVDFTVGVQFQNHSYHYAVEISSQGYPRYLRESIGKLQRFHHRSKRHDYLVVGAPFITAEGAAICREEEVGYFDFAGNCRLVYGNIFIERLGQPNRFRQQPTAARNLYGQRSERVLRVLLSARNKPWKVIPLAEAAQVSTGTASIVRSLLLQREWAREIDGGLQLTLPEKLVKDWVQVWTRRREKPTGYFTPLKLELAEMQMAEFARQTDHAFALTGTAGAWRRAPMTRYNRTQAYWEGDPAHLAEALNFKPAEEGANIHLFKPRDTGVFFNREEFNGVPVVAPLQLYLDLMRDPARGEEAADHLWSTVLFPPHA